MKKLKDFIAAAATKSPRSTSATMGISEAKALHMSEALSKLYLVHGIHKNEASFTDSVPYTYGAHTTKDSAVAHAKHLRDTVQAYECHVTEHTANEHSKATLHGGGKVVWGTRPKRQTWD